MKNLVVVLLLGICFSLSAQTKYFETEIEGLRTDLREEAKLIFEDNMLLTPEQAEIFWPLYDEYVGKFKVLGDKEVELTEEYMLNYMLMEEDIASKLLDDIMKLESDKLALKHEYVTKMKDEISPKVAGRFYQIDKRLNLLIDLEKVTRLPMLKKD